MRPGEAVQDNALLHVGAGGSVMAVLAAATLGVWLQAKGAGGGDDEGPDLDKMEAIEASLAYKSPEPEKKQPQKEKRAPKVKEPETGILKNDKLEKKPKDEPVTKPDDVVPDIDEFKRPNRDEDEDLDIGETKEELQAFDGSEFGFASETKGDPYFQALIADLVKGWEYPELLSDEGVPVGCMHLEPDGRIVDTVLKEKSENGDLNDSVETALKRLVKLRNDEPREVPAHLLKQTRSWICFKFDARKQ